MRVGRVFLVLGVEVTAADRAAATSQRWGTDNSARLGLAPHFSGEALREVPPKRLPPQRELSAVRLTEDKPLL